MKISASDEITKKIFDKSPDVVSKSYQGAKQAGSDILYVEGKTLKGICIILGNGTEFTTKNVMKAVKQIAFHKTGSIKYSGQNVDMEELKKSGSVTVANEHVTEEVMQFFDKYCKKFGVKYNAVLDERDPENPSYMLFFNGKNDKIILKALQEAYLDYEKSQVKREQGKEPQKEKGKKKNKRQTQEKESVRAKLAFFRNRVADRDKEQENVERHHNRSERQR